MKLKLYVVVNVLRLFIMSRIIIFCLFTFSYVANAFPLLVSLSPRTGSIHKKNKVFVTTSTQFVLSSKVNGNSDENDDNDDNKNISNNFMSNLARTGMKDLEELQVGDVVVAKIDAPALRIWKGSGYEITAMYVKGANPDTGLVEEIPLETFCSVQGNGNRNWPSSYKKYLKVYNPRDHREDGPVIVSPEEIGLVTVRSEIVEAMLLAIPGFFWVFVAAAFASSYNEQYGGTFWNAFFRT